MFVKNETSVDFSAGRNQVPAIRGSSLGNPARPPLTINRIGGQRCMEKSRHVWITGVSIADGGSRLTLGSDRLFRERAQAFTIAERMGKDDRREGEGGSTIQPQLDVAVGSLLGMAETLTQGKNVGEAQGTSPYRFVSYPLSCLSRVPTVCFTKLEGQSTVTFLCFLCVLRYDSQTALFEDLTLILRKLYNEEACLCLEARIKMKLASMMARAGRLDEAKGAYYSTLPSLNRVHWFTLNTTA